MTSAPSALATSSNRSMRSKMWSGATPPRSAAVESGGPFRIQIAGERFHVPRDAAFSVEHERGEDEEEVEFQLKWRLSDAGDEVDDEPEV